MQHWSQLATRNWRAKSVRTAGALLAIALGVSAVVWVTCCFESVRQTVTAWAGEYIGRSHINIQSPAGKYANIPHRILPVLQQLELVEAVAPMLTQRLRAVAVSAEELREQPAVGRLANDRTPEVDFDGIDLQLESAVRPHALTGGRMLQPTDEFAAVVDEALLQDTDLQIGDYLLVWGSAQPDPVPFEIVGTFERPRIGRIQKPVALVKLNVLQRITVKQGMVTALDVVVRNPTEGRVREAAAQVRRATFNIAPNAKIRTSEWRMHQIDTAQRQQGFMLSLLSCVALLTALFIILSTLSIGMVERVAQLGLLRCVGATRLQMATLVFNEVIPLGLGGIALGIPLGLALVALTVRLVPEYVGSFAVDWSGLLLAVIAGLATAVAAAIFPALAAARISPMEATHSHGRRSPRWLIVATAALAIALLCVQAFGLVDQMQRAPDFIILATVAIALLYAAYALLSPLIVLVIGTPAVIAAASALRVQIRLLADQVGHAVWRSAGICCGLMVGLSLIVALVVFSESVTAGWQFPKQFPEAFVWSFDQLAPNLEADIAATPGVGAFTSANAINVHVEEKPLVLDKVYQSVTWFLGCDPDSFFDLLKIEFVEGSLEEARERLKMGGYVVITDDFARSRRKGMGDKVRVYVERWHDFEVAAIITSPALDIAANYFQLEAEATVVANGSVLGTSEDMRRIFGIHGTRLVLLNFDLPESAPPRDWPPPRNSPGGARLPASAYDPALPLGGRWRRAQEHETLRELCARVNAPQAYFGTARDLKERIDDRLREVTYLLTAVPAVALLVAAIGVANLMTANITSRAKQLAMMRAVGATRGLILRLVIGEAIVLGLLGSGLGLLLGIHLAQNIVIMTARMWGFEVPLALPWAYIAAAAALTVGLCVLAAVAPARRASRTNIVEALHVP